MTCTETPLSGVFILEPKVFGDARGYFYESYNRKTFAGFGIDADFVQENVSRSQKGVVRGLHYQINPHAQGKLVRVAHGEVFDVVVDIRKGSPTFGKWFGITLSAENKLNLWVPPGFAHGFSVISESAEFAYKVTELYAPAAERSMLWNDPDLGITWSAVDESLLSDKDRYAPRFKDAEMNFSV